jgi:ATP-dependent Lon protease
VLPVGGVREKILAARRAGIKTVLLPRHNEKDLIDIPAEVKSDITLRFVDTLDDVVLRLFELQPGSTTKQTKAPARPVPRLSRIKLENARKKPRPTLQ